MSARNGSHSSTDLPHHAPEGRERPVHELPYRERRVEAERGARDIEEGERLRRSRARTPAAQAQTEDVGPC